MRLEKSGWQPLSFQILSKFPGPRGLARETRILALCFRLSDNNTTVATNRHTGQLRKLEHRSAKLPVGGKRASYIDRSSNFQTTFLGRRQRGYLEESIVRQDSCAPSRARGIPGVFGTLDAASRIAGDRHRNGMEMPLVLHTGRHRRRR